MNQTHARDKLNYWYISGIITFHYIYFTFMEYHPGKLYNISPQSFANIGLFFIIVVFNHTIISFFPSILYCRKIKKGDIFSVLKINPITKQQFLYSFLIFIMYNIISAILITFQDIILRLFDSNFIMNDYIIADNFPTLIVLVLTAGLLIPICEELFFRGFLIGGLSGLGTKFAIFASAYYFAIYHNNPYRFITLMLFGVMIGYIVHYTNSIIPGIIFHILTNTIFEIYAYLQGKEAMTKQYNSIADSQFPILNNPYFLGIALIVCCFICLYCFKKLNKISTFKRDNLEKFTPSYSRKGHILIILTLVFSFIIFVSMALWY